MARKRNTLGVKAQLDREIKALDVERERLVTARAALDGKTLARRPKPQRFSQDDVAAYLAEHPASTYIEIAEGLGALATNIAAHLNRGQKTGRFANAAGKWSLG
jgi:hypothetical protein